MVRTENAIMPGVADEVRVIQQRIGIQATRPSESSVISHAESREVARCAE